MRKTYLLTFESLSYKTTVEFTTEGSVDFEYMLSVAEESRKDSGIPFDKNTTVVLFFTKIL